jgi:uncharacterized protein (TIGR03083 family)
MPDNTWNFMDPASQDRVLTVIRRDADDFFALVSDPARWQARTACEGWEVRDVVGHMIDATEGYFPGWEAAHTGAATPEPLGLTGMAARCDANAKAFRSLSQDEAIARLRADFDQLMVAFEKLDNESWSGLIVSHPYMGPLPAMFFAIFQLVDYAVHGWDIRQGTDAPHGLGGDSADLLVPLMFVLWQATTDASSVTEPFSVGVRVTGLNGGDVRIDVSPEGLQYAPGAIDDLPVIIDFDAASFVLTAYGRMNAGTVRGDAALASRLRSLFFAV